MKTVLILFCSMLLLTIVAATFAGLRGNPTAVQSTVATVPPPPMPGQPIAEPTPLQPIGIEPIRASIPTAPSTSAKRPPRYDQNGWMVADDAPTDRSGPTDPTSEHSNVVYDADGLPDFLDHSLLYLVRTGVEAGESYDRFIAEDQRLNGTFSVKCSLSRASDDPTVGGIWVHDAIDYTFAGQLESKHFGWDGSCPGRSFWQLTGVPTIHHTRVSLDRTRVRLSIEFRVRCLDDDDTEHLAQAKKVLADEDHLDENLKQIYENEVAALERRAAARRSVDTIEFESLYSQGPQTDPKKGPLCVIGKLIVQPRLTMPPRAVYTAVLRSDDYGR